MARRKATERAFGKALALWEAPDDAGEARFCVASTFTFDATFFETECLGRFLGMDSHPSESDAIQYMVEREEKLAAARVVVLADRRHAREKESLRWDVLGVLARGDAIQHSKISLLVWANHLRIIIGSGNLTEPGYRKNLEVFGVMELNRKDGGDRESVLRVLDFLGELIAAAVGSDEAGAPKARAAQTLRSVRTQVASWPHVRATSPTVVFGGPERSVLSQLREAWPSSRPPRTAFVVSPFFDRDGTGAMSALCKIMAQRGPRKIVLDVRTQSCEDGRTRIFAPRAMVEIDAKQGELTVRSVSAEQAGERRDLHAKMIYLSNDEWCVLLAGSSNFTRAGLGAGGRRVNFEANLLYRVRTSDPEAKVLDEIWPEIGEEIDIESESLIWDPESEIEESGEAALPLPAAFQEASYIPGDPASLAVTLVDPLPPEWIIRMPGGEEIFASADGRNSGVHTVIWQANEIPFVLEVAWRHPGGTSVAHWPVNVSNPAKLPPPEVLRTLTLEELLQVLASTRPMPQAVAEVFASRKRRGAQRGAELDPLRRFDSQSFLLRRTKRLSAALERMRERLERPVSSLDAYEWRLFGPVGPMALADCYMREASYPGEAKFCLAEIALALRRVRPEKVAADGFPPSAIVEVIGKSIEELMRRAAGIASVPDIDRYVEAAFEEALR